MLFILKISVATLSLDLRLCCLTCTTADGNMGELHESWGALNPCI